MKKETKRRNITVVAFLAAWMGISVQAQEIAGTVTDRQDGEPLTGATIRLEPSAKTAVADADGNFRFDGLKTNTDYTLTVNYVAYKPQTIKGVRATTPATPIKVEMESDAQQIGEVAVTGVLRNNTEAAQIEEVRNSRNIVSAVSAQEISRTQDSNAGEVVRRVPGVSIIDGRFVMVRGLSQRYNNVWINGGAVPSSEADARSFSFDMIPGAQMDNLQIVKTPSPEYPADYSGGFIIINTKDIPSENMAEVQIGGSWNDASAFSSFLHGKASGTDFLGFDNGKRSLKNGIGTHLAGIANGGTSLTGNGLNNDWRLRQSHPIGDLKLAASMGRQWNWNGNKAGLIAALNYSNEYRTYTDMQNNLFGVYDAVNGQSNYLRHSIDDQYNHNVRLGAMLNLTMLSANGKNKYQFKNIFNQIGNDRYTWRTGISAQSDNENSAEYYYRSRTTYNTQFTGKHTIGKDQLDWSVAYAYANRNVPDRKRYLVNDALETGVMQLTTANDISREWTRLNEHIASVSANENHDFHLGQSILTLKSGIYGEYRTRKYTTRNFIYNWDPRNNTLPAGFRKMDMAELLSTEEFFGENGLYLLEELKMRNNYEGKNTLGAAYAMASLPVGKIEVNGGLRLEHNHMELISNTRDTERSPFSHHYRYTDLFPTLNATWKVTDSQQLRIAYGKTVNRPEFREVSPSVFYDFDLAADVQGNTALNPCYIHNADIRYEFYPSRGETISLAAFYKYFDSPIEWTYTVAGGTNLIYSYKNAKRADNYGIELDIRKRLDFIGLPDFSWSFNGTVIWSKVKFEEGAKEENRPMQGQSPYLINTGLFYNNQHAAIDVALLYNRIGKRIIGVGRSEGTTGGNETLRVPDSYEMPRDMIDFSASKRMGKHWEVKINIRDLLAQRVVYRQFAKTTDGDGHTSEIAQTTRSYKPGRNFGLTATYKF
ncbi:MAG: TonB-dependent receptor domain-containing protein [Prevotella sp.]